MESIYDKFDVKFKQHFGAVIFNYIPILVYDTNKKIEFLLIIFRFLWIQETLKHYTNKTNINRLIGALITQSLHWITSGYFL